MAVRRMQQMSGWINLRSAVKYGDKRVCGLGAGSRMHEEVSGKVCGKTCVDQVSLLRDAPWRIFFTVLTPNTSLKYTVYMYTVPVGNSCCRRSNAL